MSVFDRLYNTKTESYRRRFEASPVVQKRTVVSRPGTVRLDAETTTPPPYAIPTVASLHHMNPRKKAEMGIMDEDTEDWIQRQGSTDSSDSTTKKTTTSTPPRNSAATSKTLPTQSSPTSVMVSPPRIHRQSQPPPKPGKTTTTKTKSSVDSAVKVSVSAKAVVVHAKQPVQPKEAKPAPTIVANKSNVVIRNIAAKPKQPVAVKPSSPSKPTGAPAMVVTRKPGNSVTPAPEPTPEPTRVAVPEMTEAVETTAPPRVVEPEFSENADLSFSQLEEPLLYPSPSETLELFELLADGDVVSYESLSKSLVEVYPQLVHLSAALNAYNKHANEVASKDFEYFLHYVIFYHTLKKEFREDRIDFEAFFKSSVSHKLSGSIFEAKKLFASMEKDENDTVSFDEYCSYCVELLL